MTVVRIDDGTIRRIPRSFIHRPCRRPSTLESRTSQPRMLRLPLSVLLTTTGHDPLVTVPFKDLIKGQVVRLCQGTRSARLTGPRPSSTLSLKNIFRSVKLSFQRHGDLIGPLARSTLFCAEQSLRNGQPCHPPLRCSAMVTG
jgi:hypothetical protein